MQEKYTPDCQWDPVFMTYQDRLFIPIVFVMEASTDPAPGTRSELVRSKLSYHSVPSETIIQRPFTFFDSSFRQDKLSKFTEWVITVWLLRIGEHFAESLAFAIGSDRPGRINSIGASDTYLPLGASLKSTHHPPPSTNP